MRALYVHPNGRWQAIDVERDVWGGLILVTRSGGRCRRGVRLRGYPITEPADLDRRLRELARRRLRHGYCLEADRPFHDSF